MVRSRIFDAAIIGGGHNGLVCAAYLARAGFSVVVAEKNAALGGAVQTEEFLPGYRNSVAAYTVGLLDQNVIDDLALKRHGLRIVERLAANFWPIDERRGLLLPFDLAGRQAAIAAFSHRDAERLPAFSAALDRAASVLSKMAHATPPNAGGGFAELVRAGWLGRRIARLPVEDKRFLATLMTKSATDFLSLWFESDVVKAAFAWDSIVGTYASPTTPGTAYVLLHHCWGSVNGKRGVWGHAIGGMGAISDAIGAAGRAFGAVIRTKAPVSEVLVENGRATGLVLSSGEAIRARAVAAGVPPKLLFRALVPTGAMPNALRQECLAVRSGSGSFRMNVALSELPDFRCAPGKDLQPHHGSGIVIGPSLDYLERAYIDARLEGWSRRPVIELVIASTLDGTLAPTGRHVASLFVQHVAPQLPAGRSWENKAEKEAFADRVIDTVTEHAPNFRASVLGRQVLSPLDLERRFGLVDGDIFHGQMSFDQLMSARPLVGYASYRMPLKGLYLCGAGAHPGGGVTGLPGRNAAREIARDLRGGRMNVR